MIMVSVDPATLGAGSPDTCVAALHQLVVSVPEMLTVR
jgi:hypothetical protein